MFKVMVIDDEPVALQHICSIIKIKCPDYDLIATAENGQEGIEKIRIMQPDVVISDVKMPLMNGIELVKAIKEKYPQIFTIIVSGYQDFEYAKGAIQSGVSDYILKPVLPSNLQSVLENLALKIEKNFYRERNKILHQIFTGQEVIDKSLEKYFTFKRYYAVVIRKNGLPRRFFLGNNVEFYSEMNEMITIFGRDEMEEMYMIPEEILSGDKIENFIERMIQKKNDGIQYLTVVYNKDSFTVTQIQEKVKRLYRVLDTSAVVGQNQILEVNAHKNNSAVKLNHASIRELLSKVDYLLKENQNDKLKKELRRLYKSWGEEQKSQLWMENMSRQILYLFRNYKKETKAEIENEYMIEDAFFYATNIDELVDMLLEVMFQNLDQCEACIKVDTPEFFNSIKQYIMEHLAEQISLQSVCRKFGVSQTYLSKLFRKYENQSFNRYLTMERMEKATALMKEDPQIFVKDVAVMVGYADQFYFSRIFRSYMGECPSDYLEKL